MPEKANIHAAIADRICIEIGKLLELDASSIGRDVNFSRFCIDSALSVGLILSLEEWMNIEIEVDAMSEYTTVNMLAQHLAELRSGSLNV